MRDKKHRVFKRHLESAAEENYSKTFYRIVYPSQTNTFIFLLEMYPIFLCMCVCVMLVAVSEEYSMNNLRICFKFHENFNECVCVTAFIYYAYLSSIQRLLLGGCVSTATTFRLYPEPTTTTTPQPPPTTATTKEPEFINEKLFRLILSQFTRIIASFFCVGLNLVVRVSRHEMDYLYWKI